jgi:hypothetical protein
MTKAEKNELVSILEAHRNQLSALSYFSYQAAETLYQRTKMFAQKYFPARGYGIELIGITFKPISDLLGNDVTAWETGTRKLLSIAQAMLDDMVLTPVSAPGFPATPVVKLVEDTQKIETLQNEVLRLQGELQSSQTALTSARTELANLKTRRNRVKNISMYVLAFLLCSFMLWNLNGWLKWSWLALHPKRISLLLSAQVLLLLGFSLPIFQMDRALKIGVYTAMFIAVIVGLFQLI